MFVTAPPQPPAAPGGERSAGDVAADPLLGLRVGSFVLTRKLGHGGMGAVYLGEHPEIGSRVAIKLLHPTHAADPAVVQRFHAEARAANLARNEHVLRVLDLGVLADRGPYLVMEFVEGTTLAATLDGRGQPLSRVAAILVQLCEALQTAHARGMVHRDLKPENVMLVQRQGQPFVMVTDFGIAKVREVGVAQLTQAGLLMGTPEYMSPEQCEGREVDARADIYALGVIAFQLVTGALPFQRPSRVQVMIAHLREAPPSPRLLRPDLSPAWEALILRALEKDPDARFPDVAALAAAIEDAQADLDPDPDPVRSADTGALELSLAPEQGWVPVRVRHASAAGAVVAFAGPLPALFQRVWLRPGPGTGQVEREAEVVRLIRPDEARRWGTDPGFAVQYLAEGGACGPSPRATHDTPTNPLATLQRAAACGDFRAVARALMGGLPRSLVQQEQARFRAMHPGLAEEVEDQVARAREARARGDLDAAAQELEAALTRDPLNVALHDARARLAGAPVAPA